MSFFSKASFVDKKEVKIGKSSILMDKARSRKVFAGASGGGGVFTKFWASVNNFGVTREVPSCLIVSCEYNLRQCVKCLDQPYLIVSSGDMNEKDFSKELAKVLLEDQSRICIEVEGLTREGSARLVKIIKMARELFDNRVLITLFGEPGMNADIEQYSEKHFKSDKVSSKSKDTERMPTGELNLENERLLNEIKASKDNTSKLVKTVVQLKSSVTELSKTKDLLLRSESDLGASKKESYDLKNKLCTLQSNLDSVQVNYDQKLTDMKNSDEIISEITQTMEDQSSTNQELIVQMRTEYVKEIEDLEKKISKQEQELETFRTTVCELVETKTKLEQYQARVEATEKERDEVQRHNLALQHDLSTEQKTREIQGRDMQKNSDELMKELAETKEDLKKKSENNDDLISKLRSDNLIELQYLKTKMTDLENARESCLESDATKVLKVEVKQTQTDSVLISLTPLSIIKNCMDQNRGRSRDCVDLVYRSVRDIKCNISYVPSNSGVKCEVEIVKGKNIMNYHHLLKFSGMAQSDKESKLSAFSAFVSSVYDLKE